MRIRTLLILITAVVQIAVGASVRHEQITAEELAEELGFDTRKVTFAFDTPVYARADFVQVNAGQAVHSPITTRIARSEIPFYYILRTIDAQTNSLRVKIGDSGVWSFRFKPINTPSARPHKVYPDVVLPQKLDPQKAIYVFLDWDPLDGDVSHKMPAEEIAGKMKRGYYLALYFSEAPLAP